MIKRIIAIVALLALMISMTTLGALSASASSDWFDKEPVRDVAYSFAVIGDIQSMTYFDAHDGTSYLGTMFDWIVENRKVRKIKYVMGLGDTVETVRGAQNGAVLNPKEWQTASAEIEKLQGAKVPYLIVRGNHDDIGGYHEYICTEEYQAQMDGFFYDPSKSASGKNSMSNCYRKIEIGNHKYLMMGLDYGAWNDEATLAWANKVVSSNPDYKVILSIHSYLNGLGNYYKGDVSEASGFDGQKIWDSFVSKHKNMFMVFCGHFSAKYPVVTSSLGEKGNKVYKVLVDPQTYDETDPSGFVLLVNIINSGKEIKLEYFSTVKEKYFGTTSHATLQLPDGTLTEYVPPVVTTAATTAETVKVTSADVTDAASGKGCGGSITSTVAVCCSMGTLLAVFAMRKKKED